jgi:hypothetical protein
MSVLQDAQEVPLTQAFTVAPEQLARGGAYLAGARRAARCFDGTTNEIECIFASETKTAGADAITIRRC